MTCGRTALYHVTTADRLPEIAKRGLVPTATKRQWWSGRLQRHSATLLFLIDADVRSEEEQWWRTPIDFWYAIVADHAYDQQRDSDGNGFMPVVLRVWVGAKHPIEEDPIEEEVGGLMTHVGIRPQCIDVWDGVQWLRIEDWELVDPDIGLSSYREIHGSSRTGDFSPLSPSPSQL
jgi:hypothetical protein